MKINFEDIKLEPAEKNNENHRKYVWKIRNENIDYNFVANQPIRYEDHCKWWESVFDYEYIFVIIYQNNLCGYIRLTKNRTIAKEENEISIALKKEYQNMGIGSHAFRLFEMVLKEKGIKQIIAMVDIKNKAGQEFFEQNQFEKTFLRFVKKL